MGRLRTRRTAGRARFLTAAANPKARNRPAYAAPSIRGELGSRPPAPSSPCTTHPEQLVGRQVLCVCNFAPKRIAGVKSEVLVTGAYDDAGVVLAGFDHPVPNGARLV